MKPTLIIFIFALVCLASPLLADEGHNHLGPNEKVGAVSFPTSCASSVQKPFERGVALLHSFEYEMANHQFQEVAERDPKCAMAYWGQAMSLYHQLWSRPSKDDLKHGRELLAQAAGLKPGTARESEYISALAVFYRSSDKLEYQKRAGAYSQAMAGLYEHNPQDSEAAVFYALSLLASGHDDDKTLKNPKKAVAILTGIFDRQPDHPGVTHYIIHSCDNPAMAQLALPAARKYAAIAPASPHAVHMPSHIFARLGLWQDDIDSNTAALAAADKMAAMNMHVMHHRMHSMDFLEYAYLQIGDDQKARAELDELSSFRRQDIEKDYQDYYDDMLTGFAARYAVERRQWNEALSLQPVAGAKPNQQVQTFWGHAVAAGHLHDAAAGREALATYERLLEQIKKNNPKFHLSVGFASEHKEVQAWAAYAQGKNDKALRLLREVANEQDKVGKGESESPAREMLADMLLDSNRPKEALAEYETSLKTDPNRFNGLYGAARAAEMTQQKEKASGYYAQLIRNCQGSSSDRMELAKAKTLVAAK